MPNLILLQNFLEKTQVPNNNVKFSKGHKITSKFCCEHKKICIN